MTHEALAWSLCKSGVSPVYVRAILYELENLSGTVVLPGAGISESFDLSLGGRQGGTDTPRCWNTLILALMEPLVVDWVNKGWGYQMSGQGQVFTRCNWCDNIFLLASDPLQLQNMVNELTAAMQWARLDWKPTSLEVLSGSHGSTDFKF